jgi:hypothetical protein
VRAPGVGAMVMKEAVNICLGVYLGMLAPQSWLHANERISIMQEVLQRLLQGPHCQNEGHELLLTPLDVDFPGARQHIRQHKHQAEEGGWQEWWHAKLQAQLFSAVLEGRLRISSQI